MKHLAKQTAPPSGKKTVSIASIFRQQARVKKPTTTIPNTPRTGREKPTVKPHSAKSGSSSHGLRKSKSRALKKQPDLHPFVAAFKESSDEYRRHLYETNALKINDTLNTLLGNLHENALQEIPPGSDEQDPPLSPLKLSVAAKYERMSEKLYQPLSQFKLCLHRINSRGEKERFEATLSTRMDNYEDYLAKRRSEIDLLQKEWEAVVGEIWKLGVGCLGESTMQKLLFKNEATQESFSRNTESDFPLFIPEQEGSPTRPGKPSTTKKRVTFEAAETKEGGVSSTPSFPNFLYQPSRYRSQVPTVSSIASNEIKELETAISTLGQKQVADLRKIEKDHHDFWKKKNAQLTRALRND